jgi:hypothetical protein
MGGPITGGWSYQDSRNQYDYQYDDTWWWYGGGGGGWAGYYRW